MKTLSENSSNLQRSTSTLYQEGHSALTQRDYSNDEITAGNAKKCEDLWERAYEDLKHRDPDLVEKYEISLGPSIIDPTQPSLSPKVIETIVKSKLEDREASHLVIKLGQQPVKVREQGEKVIKFILWSNDIISQALSAQPYAALAWSGVSILLPVSSILIESFFPRC